MSTYAPVAGQVATKVSSIEMLKDSSCTKTTVGTTSKDLETLLGVALPDSVQAVTLVTGSLAVRYNPAAAADANDGLIPTVFTIWGQKATLDTAEFYAAADTEMSVIVHVTNFTEVAV